MIHFVRGAAAVVMAACLTCFAAADAQGQDPRASSVQKTARDWLLLIDRGDAQATWRAAGKKFQDAMPADGWAKALNEVRPPLGNVVDRAVLSTEFSNSFPGVPDGEYALLVFRSSFANKADSRETVTLEREADGSWRVIGYFIR